MAVHPGASAASFSSILPVLQLPARGPGAAMADPHLLGPGLLGRWSFARPHGRLPSITFHDVLSQVNEPELI